MTMTTKKLRFCSHRAINTQFTLKGGMNLCLLFLVLLQRYIFKKCTKIVADTNQFVGSYVLLDLTFAWLVCRR